MSIIVYGAVGCGKSKHAEALRQYFCCSEVVDADFDPYPLSKQQIDEFKNGSVLFLTDIDPILNDYNLHYGRVFSYQQAARAAGIK